MCIPGPGVYSFIRRTASETIRTALARPGRYGETLEKLVQTTQFTVPAVVSGKRIPRTRARFDCPWLVVGVADVDEELVDKTQLTAWLAVGGRRIGLGGAHSAGPTAPTQPTATG